MSKFRTVSQLRSTPQILHCVTKWCFFIPSLFPSSVVFCSAWTHTTATAVHYMRFSQFRTCELCSWAASIPSNMLAISRDIGVPLWSIPAGPTGQGLRFKLAGSFLPITASGSSSLRFFPWRRHGCSGTARTRTSQGNLQANTNYTGLEPRENGMTWVCRLLRSIETLQISEIYKYYF